MTACMTAIRYELSIRKMFECHRAMSLSTCKGSCYVMIAGWKVLLCLGATRRPFRGKHRQQQRCAIIFCVCLRLCGSPTITSQAQVKLSGGRLHSGIYAGQRAKVTVSGALDSSAIQ